MKSYLFFVVSLWILVACTWRDLTSSDSIRTVVAAEDPDLIQEDLTDESTVLDNETIVDDVENDEEYIPAPTIYVIDPLDVIDEDWTTNGIITLEAEAKDFIFGNSSIRATYSLPPSSEFTLDSTTARVDGNNSTTTVLDPSSDLASFGWILPTPNLTYNCLGATHVSLWYRPVKSTGFESVRVVFYDDTPCLSMAAQNDIENSNTVFPEEDDDVSNCFVDETMLDRHVVLERSLPLADDDANVQPWREMKIPITPESLPMDLRRLRGWKIELTRQQPNVANNANASSTTDAFDGVIIEESSLLVDQLSCPGKGDMFGSAFYVGEFINFETEGFRNIDTVKPNDVYWYYTVFQSNTSLDNTQITLSPEGILDVDYTVEQVESWGGFIELGVLCPGNAYYNVSSATDIRVEYNIPRASSEKERAIFRLVLQDSSDCTGQCDESSLPSERYYSFNPILDDVTTDDSRTLMIPLVGGETPDNPFWLTGWSGITGNRQLDLAHLKGFFLELVLDSQLGIGGLVDGRVQFSNMMMVQSTNANGTSPALGQTSNDQCKVETQLYVDPTMPQFKRLEFMGSVCCEVCSNDPTCLYALATGRDCFVASEIDPSYVSLITWKSREDAELGFEEVFWIDSVEKRGDFCEICLCNDEMRSIDCRGQDLVIIPKTFTPTVNFIPKTLDLRENPRLIVMPTGSLDSIGDGLESIRFPSLLQHIGFEFFDDLPTLKEVRYEESSVRDSSFNSGTNYITSLDQSFSEICCSRGKNVDFDASPMIEFCDFQVDTPGVDSLYLPFTMYPDDGTSPIALLYPSSDFMAEAAESVEKCAQYCTITFGCRYFMYDARFPNAEHICYLLATIPGPAYEKCCVRDDYADLNQTLPGWTTGIPPRTRHEQRNATVRVDTSDLVIGPHNDFSAEYSLSLGSTPIRGAVWIEPIVRTEGFAVEILPQKVVLYDEATTIKVRVKLLNPEQTSRPTFLIENSIQSCDVAYLEDQGNVIYVEVQQDGDDMVNLSVLIPVLIVLVALIVGLFIFLQARTKKSHEDSLWKVEKDELVFDNPPEICGRGTFGLVILADYRGTRVAVKRAAPPRNNKSIHFAMMDLSSDEFDDTDRGRESGSMTFGVEDSGGRGVSAFQPKRLSLSGQRRGSVSMTFDVLKSDFIEEMRILSRLRHPCITTVMGGVLSKDVEPMLVMEWMEHGSLYDLLHNETFVFEGDMLLNILRDISQGLRFLHVADPQIIHGDLKAANILVDRKFRAKVADFGLSQKQRLGATGTPFWMSPELLRLPESRNTAASDIYAFGIILYEVYSRKDPYFEDADDHSTILKQIAEEGKRPPVPPSSPAEVQSLMTSCLMDKPDQRPSAEEIDIRLRRAAAEQVTPKRDVKMSLHDMFPPHIAQALEEGKDIEPEHRDEVTIFFSDIVSFTTISSTLSPRKVAKMLDRLYRLFDELSAKHDVFKVETIGDAYLCVTNLVKDQPNDHAKRIAEFAVDAVQAANSTLIDLEDESKGYVKIRVGFHSGPIVADVVGNRNRKYTLFGDTINTASRMESTSKTDRIQCSEAAALILTKQAPDLPLKSRGMRPIKGKGYMRTFWVNEGESSDISSSFMRRHTAPADDLAMLQWAGHVKDMVKLDEDDEESQDGDCFKEATCTPSYERTTTSSTVQSGQATASIETSTSSISSNDKAIRNFHKDDIEIGTGRSNLTNSSRRVTFTSDLTVKANGKHDSTDGSEKMMGKDVV